MMANEPCRPESAAVAKEAPAGVKTIWSLQVLRFVAALMVVYVHAAQTAVAAVGSGGIVPHRLQGIGLAGVDIFFVLSGVIIALTAPGMTWREFAWRRVRRIVPLYLLATIPYAVLYIVEGRFGWRQALATLLLWPATDRMTAPALPAAWTLCFEMLFYAAAAFVLFDRRLVIPILALFVAACTLRSAGPLFQFLGNPLIIEFGFGVAIAHLPRWRGAIVFLPIGALAMLLAAGLPGTLGDTNDFLAGDNGFQRVLAYGLPAALIVYGTMAIKATPSIWTELGDASYTLYLTHTLPITALLGIWASGSFHPDLIILVSVAASVLLAWRLYVRIELPLLRLFGRGRQRSAVPQLT